jgi:hypothetical protein
MTKLYKTYNIIIRGIIIIASLFFLYHQLFVKRDFADLMMQIFRLLNNQNILPLLLLALALMPLNWSMEAIKWRYLLKDYEVISFGKALKAVLAGASISAVSPNRTGDYLGRVFMLNQVSFWRGVLITIVGSYAQTITTLFFGGLSFFILISPQLISNAYLSANQLIVFGSLFFIALLLLLVFYFKMSFLSHLIPSRWRKINHYTQIFAQFKFKQLFITLLISMFRYFIFSLQYFILLKAVGFHSLSYGLGFTLISSIFLVNSIRPTIALLEIGIRGSVALFIFEVYFGFSTGIEGPVFVASTLIWLINIILPALMGLLFIKDILFFKSQNK